MVKRSHEIASLANQLAKTIGKDKEPKLLEP